MRTWIGGVRWALSQVNRLVKAVRKIKILCKVRPVLRWNFHLLSKCGANFGFTFVVEKNRRY